MNELPPDLVPGAGLVVYTAIFGEYDELVDPKVISEGVRYICFTDNPQLTSKVWEICFADSDSSPGDSNRKIKLLPHRFLPPHEYSLYIDGNVEIIGEVATLMRHYASLTKIGAPIHPFRQCVYEEARACIQSNKGNADKIREVMDRYRFIGCPANLPMFEMHIIFRKTHDREIISLMEAWWNEYSHGPMRDQISFPYVVWRSGLVVTPFVESPRYSTRIFRFRFHNHERNLSPLRRFVLGCRLNQHNSYGCRLVANLADLASKVRRSSSSRRL
jgi:hypothetical protein